MKWLIIASFLILGGCGGGANLPDPRVELPEPPASLMQPGRELKTIQDGVTDE